MQDRRWTVQELAKSSSELLQRQGMESPRLDADLLLADALGVERLQLYVEFDRPVEDEARARFREHIKRRLTGEPVAYILGVKNFLDWQFTVSPAVLIPRPETELLVETIASLLDSHPPSQQYFVEIGVGSGCITLSTLLLLPESRATAIDLSTSALSVATANANRLGVESRVQFIEGDLLQISDSIKPVVLSGEGAPSVIVSNPPYITDAEMESLAVDVRDHEPHLALRSDSPLDLHKRLCVEAREFLDGAGSLAFELPGKGADELAQFIHERWSHLTCFMRRDLSGLPRVFVATPNPLPKKIDRYFSVIGNV